jgi:hypothetical protein
MPVRYTQILILVRTFISQLQTATLTVYFAELPLLHPSLLPLTKIKRWMYLSSSRPKTIKKKNTDQQDIIYMLAWLNAENLKVRFADYAGTEKKKLLRFMATFYHKFKEDEDFCLMVKGALYEEDWELMLESEPMETESTMPPTD